MVLDLVFGRRMGQALLLMVMTLGGLLLLFATLQATAEIKITEEWEIAEGESETIVNETLQIYQPITVNGELRIHNTSVIFNLFSKSPFIVGPSGSLQINSSALISTAPNHPAMFTLANTSQLVIRDTLLASTSVSIIGSEGPPARVTLSELDTNQSVTLNLFNVEAALTDSRLEQTTLIVTASQLTISDSTIANSSSYGIYTRDSAVELSGVNLWGHRAWGFKGLNATLNQTATAYQTPQSTLRNQQGKYQLDWNIPVEFSNANPTFGAQLKITNAFGYNETVFYPNSLPWIRTFTIPVQAVTYEGTQLTFPYTLTFKSTLGYEGAVGSGPSATHVLNEVPEGNLVLTLIEPLIDLEIEQIDAPEKLWALEYFDLTIVVANKGNVDFTSLGLTLYQGLIYQAGDSAALPAGENVTFTLAIQLREGDQTLNITVGQILEDYGATPLKTQKTLTVTPIVQKYKDQQEGSLWPIILLVIIANGLILSGGIYLQYRRHLAKTDREEDE